MSGRCSRQTPSGPATRRSTPESANSLGSTGGRTRGVSRRAPSSPTIPSTSGPAFGTSTFTPSTSRPARSPGALQSTAARRTSWRSLMASSTSGRTGSTLWTPPPVTRCGRTRAMSARASRSPMGGCSHRRTRRTGFAPSTPRPAMSSGRPAHSAVSCRRQRCPRSTTTGSI